MNLFWSKKGVCLYNGVWSLKFSQTLAEEESSALGMPIGSFFTKHLNQAAGRALKSRPQTSADAAKPRQIALSLIGSGYVLITRPPTLTRSIWNPNAIISRVGKMQLLQNFSKTLQWPNCLELIMLKSCMKTNVWNTIVKVRSLFVGSSRVHSVRNGLLTMSSSSGNSGSSCSYD